MSTKRRLKRFSDNTYFRNLGFETLGDMAVGIASSGLKIFLRYCVFGGLLGSFWVIAMLEPQGPLLLYILPLIALGFPLCLISEYRTGWTLFFSILLLMIIGSITVGYLYNVYQEATATGQTIPHIAVGIIGFIVCFLIIFIYKKRHEENSGGGIRISWFIGVLVYLSISGVIFYLYFVRRQPIESSAAILLCVVAFAICLALVLIRVYWLDAMQAFKAMRLSDVPLDNIFLLLELLMPRSMFIFVIMPSLLVSEAMLFAIIHYTTQNTSITQNTPVIVTNQAEPRKPSLNLDNQDGKLKLPRKLAHPENQERRTGLENKEPRSRNTLKNREKLPHPHHGGDVRGSEPVKKNSGVSSTCEIAPRAPPATTSPENYRIFSWLWFTIAPYVFPKNADGTEIQAPYWIKPFGRLLLSIMFLLILTYHLNIWSQFRSCYYKLIDLVRHNAHLPTADLSLREQWLDAQKEVRYRLDYYSNIWRRLILYASVAPFNSLVWKIILHPGRAFWEGLYQLYRYCIFSWPQTALFGFAFLLVITSPIALWVGEFEPLMYCVGPLLGVAVILAILRKWWNVHPPRILSMFLPVLFLLHLLLALIYFFTAIGVQDVHHTSLYVLFYSKLFIIALFPLLYFFVEQRLTAEAVHLWTKVELEWDAAKQVRLAFLEQFFYLEQRDWVINALIYRIHPVRSRALSVIRVGPSLQIGFLKLLRSVVGYIRGWRDRIFRNVHSAITTTGIVIVAFYIPIVVIFSIGTQQDAVTVFTQVGWLLFCIGLPSIIIRLISFLHYLIYKTTIDKCDLSIKRLLMYFCILSFATTFLYFSSIGWYISVRQVLRFIAMWCGSFPLLAFFALQHNRNGTDTDHDEQSLEEHQTPKLRWLERWIDGLMRKEKDLFSRVYKRIHYWGRTELHTRNQMCEGLVKVIEHAQNTLSTGRWFREDRRELERVAHLWLGPMDTKSLIQPTKEIIELFIYAVDVLGAVLYDYTDPEHRVWIGLEQKPETSAVSKRQTVRYQPPDLDVLLEMLKRLLLLSRPKSIADSEFAKSRFASLERAVVLEEREKLIDKLSLTLRDIKLLLDELVQHSAKHIEVEVNNQDWKKYHAQFVELAKLLEPYCDLSQRANLEESEGDLVLADDEHTPPPEANNLAAGVESSPTDGASLLQWLSSSQDNIEVSSERDSTHKTPLSHWSLPNQSQSNLGVDIRGSGSVTKIIGPDLSTIIDPILADNVNFQSYLPTPLALLYQQIYNKCWAARSHFAKGRFLAPIRLQRSRTSDIADLYYKHTGQREVEVFRRELWEDLRTFYKELMAYILGGMKAYLLANMSNGDTHSLKEYKAWLNLGWECADVLEKAADLLHRRPPDEPNAKLWAGAFQLASHPACMPDLAAQIENRSVNITTQQRVIDALKYISAEINNSLFNVSPMYLFYNAENKLKLPLSEKKNPLLPFRVCVEFLGVSPQIRFIYDYTGTVSPSILDYGTILWKGRELSQLNRLEIWTARWLLELLLQSAYSWELWLFKDEHTGRRFSEDEVRNYRLEKLNKIKELVDRIGILLPMEAHEDQELIDHLFDKLDKRLLLLDRNLKRPPEETPLQTEYSFEPTINYIKGILDKAERGENIRMAQLIYAGILPSLSFSYLRKVGVEHGGSLHFSSGDYAHSEILPLKLWLNNRNRKLRI